MSTTLKILNVGISPVTLEAELCKRSLRYFTEKCWHEIEPSTHFIPGWHIDAICEHLEAVTRGDIRNLVINMPPRHAKSILVSVVWPAWVWIFKPESRWIFSSYAASLSKRDSLKCRRVIGSNFYQTHFGHSFQLQEDQNEKMRFENDRTGFRLSTSVGGVGTGEGGDFVVCDDPHKTDEAESSVIRESTLTWWDEVMSTRGNNPKTFARVIVMQRVHQKDLSGHVLAKGGYEHLCLPAEYTGSKHVTSIGWKDPRNINGQLLWPERFGKKELDDLKLGLGSSASQGQLQQNPITSEGGLFKRKWWQPYKILPNVKRIVQFWDCAQKVGITNDYSVCATWAECDNGYYLLNIWRNKVEAPQLEQAVKNLYAQFRPSAVMIEDKSSGSSLIQNLRQKTTLPILAFDPKQRDKEVRASAVTPTVEAGRCFIPESAEWLEEFLLEHERFPNAEHDDQCFEAGTIIKTSRGDVPIEEIKIGDNVITPFGADLVTASNSTGFSETIFWNDLNVTENHPVFDEKIKSFVEIKNHSGCINKFSALNVFLWRYKKLLYSMESNLDLWGRESIILVSRQQMLEENILKDFMLRFGNFIIQKKFLLSMKFIIKMVTLTITTYLTLSVYQCQSIAQCLNLRVKKLLKDSLSIWRKFVTCLKIGTRRKMVEGGTLKMQKPLCKKESLLVSNVNTADQSINQNTDLKNSVQIPVLKSFTIGKKKVFNLTVLKFGCYYANNVLVSNCDTTSMALEYLSNKTVQPRIREL